MARIAKNRKILIVVVALFCALLMSVLSVANATAAVPATPTNLSSSVRVPTTGTQTKSGGSATIDYSNTSEGYVMVRYSGSASRCKVQVTKSGSTTYTYEINTSGRYETLPLTSGDGSYTINVFENVYGTSYALATSVTTTVTLSNALLPYLYPSQQVNFNADSKVVTESATLNANTTEQLTIVSNVYNAVISTIKYDDAKASDIVNKKITSYLPSVDSIWDSKKGICYDYAAVMASMLRSQNIPTRMQVGYVSGGVYHAWLSVYINELGWVNGVIYFDGTSWKLMDPTFAASANQSSSIMNFIGNGSNYSPVYTY